MTRLHVPVTLRWSDLDAYAHVNNVAMFRLLEDARITAFWQHPEAPEGEEWPTAVVPTGPDVRVTSASDIIIDSPRPPLPKGVLFVSHRP